jgi:GTPase SAR1 family protein
MISIPLILPILGWIGLGLVGLIGVATVVGAFDDPKKTKLGVLGMQGSGKTRFLSFLRNIPFIEGSTSRKKYESFKYTLINGKKITISSGVDIGGGDIYRSDYNEILDESDVILYFFDIGKYLRNEIDADGVPYQRSCNSRFEHIFSSIKKTKKPILIIATHKDKSGLSEQDMERKFNALVQKKRYKTLLKAIEYVNLTDRSEITKMRDELFRTK